MSVPKWLCHGEPSRSLRWRGRPMPLCARCFGFYLALGLGLAAGGILRLAGAEFRWNVWALIAALVLSLLPLMLDGWTQEKGWRKSTNPLRLATGALLGGVWGFAFATLALHP